MSAHTIGQRIRELRKLRQLSVRQLALKVSVSVSLIEKLECGDRNPSPALIAQLARALSVGVERLTGQPYTGAETEDPAQAVIPDLRRVLVTYDNPDDLLTPARPLPVLKAEVDHVSRMRRDGHYGPMGPLLPGLISELTHVALGADDEQRRVDAFHQLAVSYRAVNSLAHKMGYHDMSLTAVERVQWAADNSHDELMQATAGYLRAGAMVRLGSYSSARRILTGLIQEVERLAPEQSLPHAHMAVIGSMLLKLAILEVRDGDLEQAQERLAEARWYAQMLPGDSLAYETSFGPTNLRIHEVAVLIDGGDTEQALARLREWGHEQGRDEWEVPEGTVAERASHHHIDVAAAKLTVGDRQGAYSELVRARKLSPTHTRYHPTVRNTAATLVRLDRRQADTVAGFARWAGV